MQARDASLTIVHKSALQCDTQTALGYDLQILSTKSKDTKPEYLYSVIRMNPTYPRNGLNPYSVDIFMRRSATLPRPGHENGKA